MNNNREKNFLKNTMIITIGKLCTQLITFFLLPLYTNILSTEEYGTVDLLNTLVSLLLPLITFQVEMAVFRDLLENRFNNKNKKTIISTGFFSVLLQCIIFGIIFLIASPFINNEYKYFLVANVIASILNSLFLQIARGVGDNTNYTIGSFISAVSTVIFNVVFLVLFKFRVNGMLLGTLIGQLFSMFYMFVSLKMYNYLSLYSFDKITLKKLWKYSLPLIPNQISWWIFTTSDRVIVSGILGLSATGLLSAANKFPSVYSTIFGLFNLSWIENISLHIKDSDINVYFNKMFNIMLNFFASMAIGLISCMPFAFPIMINEKFNGGYNIIPILILASLFFVVVSLLAVIYTANRNTKEVAYSSIFAAIINLVSHLLLIKYTGLYAAALSTLLSYFVMSIYRIIDVNRRYFTIKIQIKNVIKIFIMFCITLFCYYINIFLINIISLILSIIFAFYINKDSIHVIINVIKTRKSTN